MIISFLKMCGALWTHNATSGDIIFEPFKGLEIDMYLTVNISVEDVVSELRGNSTNRKELFEYESVGDWDFTLMLADHFDELRAIHAKEAAEDGKGVK